MDMTRKKYITPLAVTTVVETSSLLLGTSSGTVIEDGELKQLGVFGTYDEEDLEIY
ncbi:MAG: hypothetical protein PUC90_05375 [Prevotella sp.]|nr:hypothetical protein [Prevotella sp.]